jgi:hypothetical protein
MRPLRPARYNVPCDACGTFVNFETARRLEVGFLSLVLHAWACGQDCADTIRAAYKQALASPSLTPGERYSVSQ